MTLEKENAIKPNNNKGYLFVKRAFDIVSSGLVLLVVGWFILLLMFIKWMEDIGNKGYKLVIKENPNGKYLSKNGKRYDCFLKKRQTEKQKKTKRFMDRFTPLIVLV